MSLGSVGQYDLLEKIAEGGMGAVFKGRHQVSGDIVAIKVVPPNLAANPVLLKRFEQEFRAASAVVHPNLVRALDFGYEGNVPFLVMEFVDGETLGQRIDRTGKMPEEEAINVIAQIAQGLYKAHIQGLVHRDVKPDNILITPDGRAKLTDMGLVKEVEADLNLTRTGRGLGTPHFMSPEQFRNAKNADARCDVYSLAATLYMALTGELPFKSCSPLDAWMKKVQNDFPTTKQLNPGVSDRADKAVRRAMSADPAQRPSTCREFVDELMGTPTAAPNTVKTSAAGVTDQWYLRYSDELGATHTVKGSLNAIRRCLKEGLLGNADNIFVSRGKAGPFEPLLGQSEFRDLIAGLPQAHQPTTPNYEDTATRPANTGGTYKPNPAPTPPPSSYRGAPPMGSKFRGPPPSQFVPLPGQNPLSSRGALPPQFSPLPGQKPPSAVVSRGALQGSNPPMPPPPPGFRTPAIEIAPVTPQAPQQSGSQVVWAVITWIFVLSAAVGAFLFAWWHLGGHK